MNAHVRSTRHFLFVLLGTGGDVWPALGLAQALRDGGDQVDVATSEMFKHDILALGLGFHSIGSREEYMALVRQPDLWSPRWVEMAIAEHGFFRVTVARVLALVNEMREQRPILVCTQNAFGARFAAELHDLACVSLVYSPQQLITPGRMPYPFNSGYRRLLPPCYGAAVLWLYDRYGTSRRVLPTLNHLRKPLGLPPIMQLREWLLFGAPSLALYPAWFDDLGPLAGAGVRQGDFILRHVDEAPALDQHLVRFLQAGPPPVVCALGTGIAHAAGRYTQVATALAHMGRRGVFVTPFDENIEMGLGTHVLRVRQANFAALFRQASLVIHHGGIGTVSQGLRAATPQLVMPFYYDQADNGDRVRRLGAGNMLHARQADTQALADAIESSSALPSAPLQRLREQALAGGGAHACVRMLEDILVPTRPPSARGISAPQEARA